MEYVTLVVLHHDPHLAGKLGAPARQAVYLRALRTLPNVTIHLGHFLRTEVRMPLADPPATGPKTVKVIKAEEKGSDVNLATYLLTDAMRRDCDVAAVVSNDSDLCEPMRLVQAEFGMPVGLLNPHPVPSQALLRLKPAFVKPIRKGPLSASQFPARMSDARGKFSKPAQQRGQRAVNSVPQTGRQSPRKMLAPRAAHGQSPQASAGSGCGSGRGGADRDRTRAGNLRRPLWGADTQACDDLRRIGVPGCEPGARPARLTAKPPQQGPEGR